MSTEKTDTRTRILETALATLENHGGKGVRMADIAKQAGVSRQAVYLHFKSRAELLDAVTRFVEEKLDIDARLAPSRNAETGHERLDSYVKCWGEFLPHVYAVARALINDMETDEAAAAAWNSRMAAMRDGCSAIIDALIAEKQLRQDWDRESATDLLWTLLSVQNWESLTQRCEWSSESYIQYIQLSAARVLIRG